MTRVEQRLSKLYKKAWQDPSMGPRRFESPALSKAEKVEYICLVHRFRLASGWYRQPIHAFSPDSLVRVFDQDTCEHCLSEEASVLLIQPRLVSPHLAGDWVCVNCDPRIQTLIEMEKLREVIGAEESA